MGLQPSEFLQRRSTAAKKRRREDHTRRRPHGPKPRLRPPMPDLPECPTFRPTTVTATHPPTHSLCVRACACVHVRVCAYLSPVVLSLSTCVLLSAVTTAPRYVSDALMGVQEEFLEPLKYIASIRERAEPYGVCKIVPPKGWDPSWPIDPKTFEFATRVQNVPRTPPSPRRRRTFAGWPSCLACGQWAVRSQHGGGVCCGQVHQLQERGEFAFWKQLKESLERQQIPLKVIPRLNGKQIDIFALYRFVARQGGSAAVGRGPGGWVRFPLRFRICIIMIRTEDEMSRNVWESQPLPW
eukprot:COSAG01_NODE_15734_length_1305_cov_1.326700_2_plen_296_part_01